MPLAQAPLQVTRLPRWLLSFQMTQSARFSSVCHWPLPTAQAAAGGGRLEVQDIIAIGSARSLYRLAPSDSTTQAGVDPPAVHYVVGSQIRIEMEGREVQGMQVTGQTLPQMLQSMQSSGWITKSFFDSP